VSPRLTPYHLKGKKGVRRLDSPYRLKNYACYFKLFNSLQIPLMYCILQFGEVDPIHDEILRKKEEQDRCFQDRHLYRLQHMAMWTKLRPGIWNFLRKVCSVIFLQLSNCISAL
jgi:hypothetical protein